MHHKILNNHSTRSPLNWVDSRITYVLTEILFWSIIIKYKGQIPSLIIYVYYMIHNTWQPITTSWRLLISLKYYIKYKKNISVLKSQIWVNGVNLWVRVGEGEGYILRWNLLHNRLLYFYLIIDALAFNLNGRSCENDK